MTLAPRQMRLSATLMTSFIFYHAGSAAVLVFRLPFTCAGICASNVRLSLTESDLRSAQPDPTLGCNNRVSWIMRVVFNRSWHTKPAVMQIQTLPQMGNIL